MNNLFSSIFQSSRAANSFLGVLLSFFCLLLLTLAFFHQYEKLWLTWHELQMQVAKSAWDVNLTGQMLYVRRWRRCRYRTLCNNNEQLGKCIIRSARILWLLLSFGEGDELILLYSFSTFHSPRSRTRSLIVWRRITSEFMDLKCVLGIERFLPEVLMATFVILAVNKLNTGFFSMNLIMQFIFRGNLSSRRAIHSCEKCGTLLCNASSGAIR